MILLDSNKDNKPLVATIGFFDGVHAGHRFLIDQLKAEAKTEGLSSAVITFPLHPREVLNSDYKPALLCGYDEKIQRLASTGVDYCIPLDFDVKMSQMSAKVFMQKILKERLNVTTLVIGYDHKFGYNANEGFDDYKIYGDEIGIKVVQATELHSSEYVSSSRIRRLLGHGDVVKVANLLTYSYTISGKIVEGFKVGRTIGFPTANIQVWEKYKVVPAFGVYAVHVHIKDKKYGGMLYIGKRPTLQNGENISLEVNIFDFDEDLYDKSLTVEFLQFVRHDEKFKDIHQLKTQINKDRLDVIHILDTYYK